MTRLPPHRRGIGWLPAGHVLLPHLDVAGNIGIGERMRGTPSRIVRWRIERFVGSTPLDGGAEWPDPVLIPAGLRTRMPHELLVGDRFRVALARALLPGPAAFVVEVPAARDPAVEPHVRQLLPLHARAARVAVLVVTASVERADSLGFERVVVAPPEPPPCSAGSSREGGPGVAAASHDAASHNAASHDADSADGGRAEHPGNRDDGDGRTGGARGEPVTA